MATYLGLKYIQYIGGTFAVPLFHISGAGDSIDITSWEGSVYSARLTDTGMVQAGVIHLSEAGYFMKASSASNLGVRIYYGTESSMSQIGNNWILNSTSSTKGFGIVALAVDDDNNYYVDSGLIYEDNAPGSYTYNIVMPTAGQSFGYALVTWAEGRHKTWTWSAGTNITDPGFLYYLQHASPLPSDDPYPIDPSEPGGGDGDPLTDDKVGIVHNPDLPSALDIGFCRAFCPTQLDLETLRSWLWDNPASGGVDIDTIKRMFSNPMESIVGLSVVPIAITGTSVNFSFGGVVPPFTLPKLPYQYYQVDCGAINISPRYGSYLDYEPYTNFSIYLPFIGMRSISADDIMGKTVALHYDIDVISGACIARLQSGYNLLYTWAGQCAMQIPVVARNWDNVFTTAVNSALSLASGVVSGGASLVGGVASASVNALITKPHIQRSGALAGSAGWMNNLTPYIIRSTPAAAIPTGQNAYIGYPSFTTVSLGDLSGYNEISSIHLEGVPATDAELSEIVNLLQSGVIF